jgi:hypothetical protein
MPSALRLLLLLGCSGCQLGFPLEGYDEGEKSASLGCGDAFLCDDFESGVDASRWAADLTAGSSVQIDESRVHRGKASIHAVVVNAGDESRAQLNHEEVLPSSAWVRLFAWVEPATVDDLVISVAMRGADPFDGMNLRVTPTRSISVTNWAAEPDENFDGTLSLPANEWVCVEWGIDGTLGQVTVEQNGVSSVSSSSTTFAPANWFQIGALLTSPSPSDAGEVWIDDVIVDDQPVGCER